MLDEIYTKLIQELEEAKELIQSSEELVLRSKTMVNEELDQAEVERFKSLMPIVEK